VPVREYRASPRIITRPGDGEFALTRDMELLSIGGPDELVVTGTYWHDKEAVFVNARLFRPGDGLVLGTGALALVQTPVIRTMLASGAGMRLAPAAIGYASLQEVTNKAGLGYVLLEEDLH